MGLAVKANLSPDELSMMEAKPIYQFTNKELDKYLGYLQVSIPDLRKRIQHIARKNLGQPYNIFLLGEYPFELYDSDPLFKLEESDCVVYSEHTYAMALGWDWPSFFAFLQRIRYKNGEISTLARNHYTELDWDNNNSWLVEDVTMELIGDKAVSVCSEYDKAKFFKKQYGIDVDIAKLNLTWYYIPYDSVPGIINKLQAGDFVNIVRGYDEDPNGKWVGHTGLITKDDDGTVFFTHSTSPKVKMEPLLAMCTSAPQLAAERRKHNADADVQNKIIKEENEKLRAENNGKPSKKEKKLISKRAIFYGFKFLRLREDPIAELIKIDGDKAPLVIGSQGLYNKKVQQLQKQQVQP